MLRSLWRGVVILLKGVGVVAAILGILLLVVLIWFSFNPLFPTPKTGQLHAAASRELRLGAGQVTVAVELDGRLNAAALRSSRGEPGPARLHAAIEPIDGATLAGVRFRIAPAEVDAPLNEARETADGLDWTLPCQAGATEDCRQRVVLIVQADPTTADRRWQLTVNGDLAYPALVPAPDGSSFNLDLRAVGQDTGSGPSPLAETSGTLELTVERPVMIVPVHLEEGGGASGDGTPAAALRLAIDVVRVTETTPAGLDAPEPVRATVLHTDGTVLTRQGVRPGQDGRILGVALDACASDCTTDYWVTFEWMDRRPDGEYRVAWRAEALQLPANDRLPSAMSIRADLPQAAAQAGVTATVRPPDPPFGSGFRVQVGGLPVDDPAQPPIHVQLLVTATVGSVDQVGPSVEQIYLESATGRNLGVPFEVGPGQTGSIVVNLEDGCPGRRCDSLGLLAVPVSRTSASARPTLGVTWLLEARAWRLVPDGPPIVLSLEVR